MIIELFSQDVTAEALPADIEWKSAFRKRRAGQFGPKFQVQGVVPTNHFSARKLDELAFYTV